MPFIKSLAEDNSWRVRYTVADKIVDLGKGLGKQLTKNNLLGFFLNFIQDNEAELKTIGVLRMGKFCELLDDSDIIQKIVPCLGNLAKDNTTPVRAALAESILQLCPLIGKKATNDHILQMFLLLLRDESSDVRVNLFKHLDDITKVIDLESLSQSLFPALNDLAIDKNWRTRASCMEFLPFFAKKMVTFFYYFIFRVQSS